MFHREHGYNHNFKSQISVIKFEISIIIHFWTEYVTSLINSIKSYFFFVVAFCLKFNKIGYVMCMHLHLYLNTFAHSAIQMKYSQNIYQNLILNHTFNYKQNILFSSLSYLCDYIWQSF